MPKGSQLLQLKTALSHAGITGQSQNNGKKRKRTAAHEQDKDKKAAKLNEIHQKLNPFDVKVTKLKHDVGGRKLKGITGRPAQSKQAGMEQVCPFFRFSQTPYRKRIYSARKLS
jgi:nucleolar protein 14